jgi:hypothetical protein
LKNETDPLIEWAVWGQLNSKSDLELILLKGHLLLEIVVGIVLKRNDIANYKDYSFYRKIIEFEKIEVKDSTKKKLIICSLKDINKLRNRIAHEFNFDIEDGKLTLWASKILDSLEGKKYTKYTYRTKIVHAFSILSMNIVELTH